MAKEGKRREGQRRGQRDDLLIGRKEKKWWIMIGCKTIVHANNVALLSGKILRKRRCVWIFLSINGTWKNQKNLICFVYMHENTVQDGKELTKGSWERGRSKKRWCAMKCTWWGGQCVYVSVYAMMKAPRISRLDIGTIMLEPIECRVWIIVQRNKNTKKRNIKKSVLKF